MTNAMQFLPRLSGALGFASWCNSNVIAIIGNGPLLIATCTVVESTSRPRNTHQSLRTLHSDLRYGQLTSPRRRRIYGTMPCRVQSRLDCSEAPCRRHAPVKEPQYLDVLQVYRSLHHVAGSTSRQCRAHNSPCKSRSELRHDRLATARRRCTYETMPFKL